MQIARRVIILYFLQFIPPLHLHIHIYAGVPVVRARAGAFNASIKQRVTPSNNSIKLRARASGAGEEGGEGGLCREEARSFVRSRGCNNVYTRRVAGRGGMRVTVVRRDEGTAGQRRDSGPFSSRGSIAETPDPKYKMLIAKPGDVYQIQPGLSPLSRYTESVSSRGGRSFSLSLFSFPVCLFSSPFLGYFGIRSLCLFSYLPLIRDSPIGKPLNIQTLSWKER